MRFVSEEYFSLRILAGQNSPQREYLSHHLNVVLYGACIGIISTSAVLQLFDEGFFGHWIFIVVADPFIVGAIASIILFQQCIFEIFFGARVFA